MITHNTKCSKEVEDELRSEYLHAHMLFLCSVWALDGTINCSPRTEVQAVNTFDSINIRPTGTPASSNTSIETGGYSQSNSTWTRQVSSSVISEVLRHSGGRSLSSAQLCVHELNAVYCCLPARPLTTPWVVWYNSHRPLLICSMYLDWTWISSYHYLLLLWGLLKKLPTSQENVTIKVSVKCLADSVFHLRPH